MSTSRDRLRRAEGALGTHRLRVFADLFLGDHLYSHFELRSDGGSDAVDGSPRSEVKQAYVRLVSGSWAAGVQAGRFATPFGAYPTWHLSTVDYFLGPPLPYGYRTVMNRQRVPMDAQDFLYWKDAPEDVDRPGAPPVWDVPYQWGAMVFGRLGPVDLRAAAMNSAPSSGPKVLEVRMESVRAPLLGRGRAHETVRFTGNRYRVQSRSVDGGHHRRHDPAATRFPPRYRSTRTARVRSGVVLRGYQLRARADGGTGGGARRPLEGAECRWHAYGRQHQPGGAAGPGGRLLRCRARWPDRLPGHR